MSLFVLTPERWAAIYGAECSSPVIRVRVTTDAGATWTNTSPGPCIDPAVVAGYHHWLFLGARFCNSAAPRYCHGLFSCRATLTGSHWQEVSLPAG
ncbi:MAG: hypothetical protein M0Z27_10365 [Thermaerobacter sp.]|nr:hypothetical protein [Thermaerobacter sp.]